MRVLCVVIVASCLGCKRHQVEAPEPKQDTPATAPAATPPPNEPSAGTSPVERAPPPASAAGARMPDGGTINGDPRGPRAAEFNRVVDGAMPQLRACFERAALPAGAFAVSVHYVVEPPGYTGAVSARGDAPQAVLDCCRGVVENLKFPEFRGKKVENDLPVTFKKTVERRTIEIWDAAPQP